MKAGELQALRGRLRKSFVEFVCWHLEWQGHTVGQLNRDMAAFLERPSRVKLLLAARGFSKSTLTIWYCAWRLLRVPSTKIHFVSHADHQAASLAETLLTFLRESPVMQPFAPGKGVGKSNYQIRYAIYERDKSVSCSGIKGSRTGIRADLIVADDVESPDNATTAQLREELVNKMNELVALPHDQLRLIKVTLTAAQREAGKEQLAALPENTQIVYVGTYQSTESVYLPPVGNGHPLSQADVGKFPALNAQGESTFPEKLPTEEIEYRRANVSAQYFALHYMIDATPLNTSECPIKVANIIQREMTPRVLECWIDPTGSSKRTKDQMESVALFGAPCEGKLYVADTVAWKNLDSFQVYNKLVDECLKRGVGLINIEGQQPSEPAILKKVIAERSMAAQSSGGQPVRIRVEPFSISNASKELRVQEALEVSFNSGNLILHPKVLLDPRTREQIQGIRRGYLPSPCDRVDILASFAVLNAEKIHAAYRFQSFRLRGTGS